VTGAELAPPPWREQDLGLGVPTHVLDVAAVAPALQPFVHADAFAPHWFVTGGLLVVSTDPAWSKDLRARASGGPAPLPHARVAFWAQLRGEHARAALDAFGKWPEWAAGPGAEGQVQAVVAALHAALAGVDRIETEAFVDGAVERARSTLRLREAPAGK
jgi:hypothetical protein